MAGALVRTPQGAPWTLDSPKTKTRSSPSALSAGRKTGSPTPGLIGAAHLRPFSGGREWW